MKKYLLSCLFALLLVPTVAFAETLTGVDITPAGAMYIDIDSVQALKKGNDHYLAVVAKEPFTNQKYLSEFRKTTGLKTAEGAYYTYLFDNHGTTYMVAGDFVYDKDGQIVEDRGQKMTPMSMQGQATLLKVYNKALDVYQAKLEEKQIQMERARRFVR